MSSSPSSFPTSIRRLGDAGLEVQWSDGRRDELSSRDLRQHCPCAECRERRGDSSHAKPLGSKPSLLRVIEHTIDEELSLEEVAGIGNYAVRLRWKDGHETGIYTFSLLRELGEQRHGTQGVQR